MYVDHNGKVYHGLPLCSTICPYVMYGCLPRVCVQTETVLKAPEILEPQGSYVML